MSDFTPLDFSTTVVYSDTHKRAPGLRRPLLKDHLAGLSEIRPLPALSNRHRRDHDQEPPNGC